jgi:hypothetical protein
VDHEPDIKREFRTSGKDFEFALDQAESLLREVDRASDRARLGRGLQAGIPFILALVLTIIIGTHAVSAWRVVVTVAICALIVIPVAAWIEIGVVLPAKRRISRDERAMIDVIGMLRELQVAVASDENWSAGRQRLIKARIARFPIGSRSFR